MIVGQDDTITAQLLLFNDVVTLPNSETENNKQNMRNTTILDCTSYSMNRDAEGLTQEATVNMVYTPERRNSIRQFQKCKLNLLCNGSVLDAFTLQGYVNSVKVSHSDDLFIMEVGLVGYTEFLNSTVDGYDATCKISEHCKKICELVGLKCVVDLGGLADTEVKITAQKADTGSSSSGGAGLTQLSGNDCTPTLSVSAYSFDIAACKGDTKIGNSSANYATDTKGMSAKEAILDVFNRFRYSNYPNNRTCPQKMWKKTGNIRGNCADISRLIKCVGEVHGLRIGIHHWHSGNRGHYFNVIEVDGKTYRFDCCFKSGYTSSTYGGELCNNLNRKGGPWQ